MSEETVPITIKILDKEFRISCPREEREALQQSAHYLNDRMSEVRDSGKVIGIDRISIMAALNIVHELLQYKNKIADYEGVVTPTILSLHNKIDYALEKGKQHALQEQLSY